jgi:ribosomal protein S28E/S33
VISRWIIAPVRVAGIVLILESFAEIANPEK